MYSLYFINVRTNVKITRQWKSPQEKFSSMSSARLRPVKFPRHPFLENVNFLFSALYLSTVFKNSPAGKIRLYLTNIRTNNKVSSTPRETDDPLSYK